MKNKKTNWKAGLKAGFVLILFFILGGISAEVFGENLIVWLSSLSFTIAISIMFAFRIFKTEIRERNILRQENLKIERQEKGCYDILGILYDPEEILDQIGEQSANNAILTFHQLGYVEVAEQFDNYIKKLSFNFSNLPNPEEIKDEFLRKFIEKENAANSKQYPIAKNGQSKN